VIPGRIAAEIFLLIDPAGRAMVDHAPCLARVDRAGEVVVVGRARTAGVRAGGRYEHQRGEQYGLGGDDECGAWIEHGRGADQQRGQLVDGGWG